MEKKDYRTTPQPNLSIKHPDHGVEQAAGIRAVEPGKHQVARSPPEHPEAYFFVDSKSKSVLVNWESGEVMSHEWTGLARGDNRGPHDQYMYWYIGRSDGERSYHAFYAQDMEDAVRKAEGCRSAEAAGQVQQLNVSNGLENVRPQFETLQVLIGAPNTEDRVVEMPAVEQEDDLEEEIGQARGMGR